MKQEPKKRKKENKQKKINRYHKVNEISIDRRCHHQPCAPFYFFVFFYFRRGVFFSFYERWANGVASPLIEIDFLIPLFFCFVVVVVVVVVAVVVWLFFATAIGRSLTSFSMNKNRAITSIELEFSLQHGVFFLIKEKQNIEINRISKKKLFWAFTVFFLFCFNQV